MELDVSVEQLKKLQLELKQFLPQLGAELLELRKKPFQIERKSDGSKVSSGDYLCDQRLTNFLDQHSPYPIISEEQKYPAIFPDEITWIIDPIDGTSHYINLEDDFAIMLALVVKRQPIFSMVYLPAKQKGYYAEKGKGCYSFLDENEEEVRLQVNKDSEERLFQISGLKSYAKEYKWFVNQGLHQYKITGGIGVKLCLIAEGSAHYYLNFSRPLKAWDLMPTILIIKESGGWVSNASGSELCYDSSGYVINKGLFVAPDGKLTKYLTAPISLDI